MTEGFRQNNIYRLAHGSGTQLSIKNRETRDWCRHATDKLKFVAQFTARALNFQLSTAYPGIGVARDCLAQFFISHTVKKQEKLHEILINFVKTLENIQALG